MLVGQRTRPARQAPHLDPCTRTDPPTAPYRWYSPVKDDTSKNTLPSLSFVQVGAVKDLLPTSSGGVLTFCRYFFTTSSGVFPEDKENHHTHVPPPPPCCDWWQEDLPLRACFLVVFLQQWPKPGTGLMLLLLTGGGCSTSLGGLVRHTGRAAALIRIPVIPETQQRESELEEERHGKFTQSSQLSASATSSSWGHAARVSLPASAG